jgi:DNA-binding GntR family transcriptional regulator
MTVSADSASEMAYQGIRKLLADGELVPGQRLSQSNLARRLCCSPMPVVEALRRLESEGLLVKQARKQARVRELSMEDLEGLSLLREAIESVTARLAAQRATPEEARSLRELAQQYEQAWEAQEDDSKADTALHRHIAKCARCPLLLAELDRFLLIERTASRKTNPASERWEFPHCHRALVQAIIDRDADSAAYLMRKHIRHGYEALRYQLATPGSLQRKPRRSRAAAGKESLPQTAASQAAAATPDREGS